MFWKKKKNKKEDLINNTPLGSCPPSNCGSCSESGCGSSVEKKENPNAINDQKISTNKIKYIVAIGSGKGGVGKSTVTVNLAHALKQEGYSVGVMDADIYGPSQAGMLGAQKDKPMAFNGMIKPMISHGISFISMANLTGGQGPSIWRAPIAVQAIQQFLHGVHWGELDFLLIDLPPGTGDIQLTLAQEAQLAGAVIVSTPQRVAAEVSRAGLEMFEKVNVPVLGIVENMSNFSCSSCGTQAKLYQSNALAKMAKETKTDILVSIPLDANLMQSCDDGKSVFETNADSPSAQAFIKLAKSLMFKLNAPKANSLAVDSFSVSEQGELNMLWSDGEKTSHSALKLRGLCQCAACVDEITGKQILETKSIQNEIKISMAKPVGLYGMALGFSDGHSTGIYKLEDLR